MRPVGPLTLPQRIQSILSRALLDWYGNGMHQGRLVVLSCNLVVDCLVTHGAYVLISSSDAFMSQVSGYVMNLVLGDLPANDI
uniref:Uncharacterized protein n=1 Tax=Setaria viridis TaxID=4556 RepID=A0A4U6W3X4_SETVI|nr:hypothetical protein SEVIR_1G032400v2 [Setaria viridis]